MRLPVRRLPAGISLSPLRPRSIYGSGLAGGSNRREVIAVCSPPSPVHHWASMTLPSDVSQMPTPPALVNPPLSA